MITQFNVVVFLVALLPLLFSSIAKADDGIDDVNSQPSKKTIVIFGITGVGKSTVSNCIFGGKGDLNSIQNGPFPVCEDAGSGNIDFEIHSNDKYTIVDTIGFGSADINATFALDRMRHGLAHVNNQIDYVLFVIKKGRLTNDTYQFIRTFQLEVMRNKSCLNSILLVNRCERYWMNRKAQRDNVFMQQILATMNDLYYEFDLKWDHSSDDAKERERNALTRQKAIDELLNFIDILEFEPIRVDYIHTREFERSWLHRIFAYLDSLATRILNGLTGLGSKSRGTEEPSRGIVRSIFDFFRGKVDDPDMFAFL